MGFGDEIKKWADQQKDRMGAEKEKAMVNAEARLNELLGKDRNLIAGITLDLDIGKFYGVDAPDHVIEKIRAAGLLRE